MIINGYKWDIVKVDEHDPVLKRSDGSYTVGVTDRNTMTVYLSDKLKGAFLNKVLTHEICHCAVFSYGIEMDIRTEEIVADYISLFGREIIKKADSVLEALHGREIY